MSRTAATPKASMSHRRVFMSHSNTLVAQPSLHLAADLGKSGGAARLVARDDDRLRVRGANQSPAIAEQHTDAVDVDDVVARAEILHGALDEIELDLLGNVDAELGRRNKVGDVRQ